MAPPDRPDLFRPRDNEPGDGASHASGPAVGASAGRGAEELLREVEARYRYVVDTQTELICRFLPDTTLTFVNDAYCRFFGRTREALLGSPFVDLLPAAHRDDVRARIAAQVRQPRIETYEHDVLLPGGTVGRQEWTDQPILDAAGRLVEIQAMGRDVTQQRRTEAALRESEARLRLALENAAMGTWSWDVPNQMVIWSEHVGPLYGLPAERPASRRRPSSRSSTPTTGNGCAKRTEPASPAGTTTRSSFGWCGPTARSAGWKDGAR